MIGGLKFEQCSNFCGEFWENKGEILNLRYFHDLEIIFFQIFEKNNEIFLKFFLKLWIIYGDIRTYPIIFRSEK